MKCLYPSLRVHKRTWFSRIVNELLQRCGRFQNNFTDCRDPVNADPFNLLLFFALFSTLLISFRTSSLLILSLLGDLPSSHPSAYQTRHSSPAFLSFLPSPSLILPRQASLFMDKGSVECTGFYTIRQNMLYTRLSHGGLNVNGVALDVRQYQFLNTFSHVRVPKLRLGENKSMGGRCGGLNI
jgi:hypothetical protein